MTTTAQEATIKEAGEVVEAMTEVMVEDTEVEEEDSEVVVVEVAGLHEDEEVHEEETGPEAMTTAADTTPTLGPQTGAKWEVIKSSSDISFLLILFIKGYGKINE